jgi:hypothetical protein
MAVLSSGVQAFGLGDLTKEKESTGSSDVGALVEQQAGIVKSLTSGLREFTAGQAQAARALGLKDEADLLDSEQEALASGNVNDEDSIDKTMRLTAASQEAINKRIAEGVTLTAESKKELVKALPAYAKGTISTIKLLPEAQKWGTSATDAITSAGIMDAPKLKNKFGTGLFVVSKLPGYVTTAKDSYTTLIAFAKSNDIDTSEAEDLLGDDF